MSFDAYTKRAQASSALLASLKEENAKLFEELSESYKGNASLTKLLASRDEEIKQLNLAIDVEKQSCLQGLTSIGRDQSFQAENLKLRFDLQSHISSKRVLERELLLQRAETDRLNGTLRLRDTRASLQDHKKQFG